jgi:hypothetical protein
MLCCFRQAALVLSLVLLYCCAPVLAQISVKAYGAVGDGYTDDTAFIQAAFNAAQAQNRSHAAWTSMSSLPTVVFPNGVYRITQTILLPSQIRVIGENNSIIKCDTPITAFRGDWSLYRAVIQNLSFSEFSTAIAFSNFVTSNLDRASVLITECTFDNRWNNTGLAIDAFPPGTNGSNATNLRIEHCTFCNVRVLRSRCDWAVVEHCWVSTDLMTDYVIENNGGVLTISNLIGVPGSGPATAWVNNIGTAEGGGVLYLVHNRFGGEAATDIVHHTGVAKGLVQLDNNAIYAADDNRCIVRCETIPETLSITNNIGNWRHGVVFGANSGLDTHVKTVGTQANNTRWQIYGNAMQVTVEDNGKLANLIDFAEHNAASTSYTTPPVAEDFKNYWGNPYTYFDGAAPTSGGNWLGSAGNISGNTVVAGPNGNWLTRFTAGGGTGNVYMHMVSGMDPLRSSGGGPGAGIYTLSFIAKASVENEVATYMCSTSVPQKAFYLGKEFKRYQYTFYFDDSAFTRPPSSDSDISHWWPNTLSICIGNIPNGETVTLGEFAVHRGPKALPFTFPLNPVQGMTCTENRPVLLGTAAPTSGSWKVGDIVYNSAPRSRGYIGWVCVTSGSPGTWKGFGAIQ